MNLKEDDRDRHKGRRGVVLSGFHVSVLRRFTRHDPNSSIATFLKQGPNPFLDVAPGEKRPLGVASLIDDLLVVHLYPHEHVFNDLLTRNVHGGPMPIVFQFSIHGGGESWEEVVDWDTAVQGQLPVVLGSFSVRTAIDWPPNKFDAK